MMTIKEMSKLTGVSARALRYYDEIGLFHPTGKSEAGYRLYDKEALAVLQQILYFRELDIPLDTIKEIMENPALDRNHILRAQKQMLTAEKERLERLIASIDEALKGAETMDFTVFTREESEDLFHAMFKQMPEAMRETAIREFGSAEEWKEHYLNAVSSEKVQKQYAKVVEWYGGREAYADSVKHPLSEEIRTSYKRRLDHVLEKLSDQRTMDVDSFEVRQLIGEYGFVMKQLLQLKEEKEMMLAQAKLYLEEKTKSAVDDQYGDGFAVFLNRAITAFYNR
ncbi:MAG: MerR family transcriptional regulator [Eubacteriales bacterium]|nr:MerR family transcriptional regulator [Eubacteriales bacterium]